MVGSVGGRSAGMRPLRDESGRLVFGLGSAEIYAMAGDTPDQLRLSGREVLASGRGPSR